MENNETTKKENTISKLIKRINKSRYKYYYIVGILTIVLLLVCLIPTYGEIVRFNYNVEHKRVCNLSTVKVYYHNVGKTEKDASGLGKIFFNYGYKKFWIEYDGTVDFSLDCEKIKINKIPLTNTVIVKLPEEVTISNARVLGDSISDAVTDKGLFTTISASEKNEAKKQAKSEMLEKAMSDDDMQEYALERAKLLLEKYIVSIGKLNNKEYKVIFK